MESTITSKLATNASNLINTPQYLSANYWFGTPDSFNIAKLSFLAIVSTLIIIAVLVLVAVKALKSNLNPPQQKFLSKIITLVFIFGPLGWFLVLFRDQGIVFVSARFWWVLWTLGLLFVFAYLLRYYRQVLPTEITKYQTYKVKRKYFPLKKKKKH